MTSHGLILASLATQLTCLILHGPVIFLPIREAELALWRKLRLSRLRKRLTRRLRVAEPLSGQRTIKRARQNMWWHVAMIAALMPQSVAAMVNPSAARLAASLFLGLASAAWLIGSLVQRQKIAVLTLSAN